MPNPANDPNFVDEFEEGAERMDFSSAPKPDEENLVKTPETEEVSVVQTPTEENEERPEWSKSGVWDYIPGGEGVPAWKLAEAGIAPSTGLQGQKLYEDMQWAKNLPEEDRKEFDKLLKDQGMGISQAKEYLTAAVPIALPSGEKKSIPYMEALKVSENIKRLPTTEIGGKHYFDTKIIANNADLLNIYRKYIDPKFDVSEAKEVKEIVGTRPSTGDVIVQFTDGTLGYQKADEATIRQATTYAELRDRGLIKNGQLDSLSIQAALSTGITAPQLASVGVDETAIKTAQDYLKDIERYNKQVEDYLIQQRALDQLKEFTEPGKSENIKPSFSQWFAGAKEGIPYYNEKTQTVSVFGDVPIPGGVNLVKAIRAGVPEATILQAGFTAPQIQDAKNFMAKYPTTTEMTSVIPLDRFVDQYFKDHGKTGGTVMPQELVLLSGAEGSPEYQTKYLEYVKTHNDAVELYKRQFPDVVNVPIFFPDYRGGAWQKTYLPINKAVAQSILATAPSKILTLFPTLLLPGQPAAAVTEILGSSGAGIAAEIGKGALITTLSQTPAAALPGALLLAQSLTPAAATLMKSTAPGGKGLGELGPLDWVVVAGSLVVTALNVKNLVAAKQLARQWDLDINYNPKTGQYDMMFSKPTGGLGIEFTPVPEDTGVSFAPRADGTYDIVFDTYRLKYTNPSLWERFTQTPVTGTEFNYPNPQAPPGNTMLLTQTGDTIALPEAVLGSPKIISPLLGTTFPLTPPAISMAPETLAMGGVTTIERPTEVSNIPDILGPAKFGKTIQPPSLVSPNVPDVLGPGPAFQVPQIAVTPEERRFVEQGMTPEQARVFAEEERRSKRNAFLLEHGYNRSDLLVMTEYDKEDAYTQLTSRPQVKVTVGGEEFNFYGATPQNIDALMEVLQHANNLVDSRLRIKKLLEEQLKVSSPTSREIVRLQKELKDTEDMLEVAKKRLYSILSGAVKEAGITFGFQEAVEAETAHREQLSEEDLRRSGKMFHTEVSYPPRTPSQRVSAESPGAPGGVAVASIIAPMIGVPSGVEPETTPAQDPLLSGGVLGEEQPPEVLGKTPTAEEVTATVAGESPVNIAEPMDLVSPEPTEVVSPAIEPSPAISPSPVSQPQPKPIPEPVPEPTPPEPVPPETGITTPFVPPLLGGLPRISGERAWGGAGVGWLAKGTLIWKQGFSGKVIPPPYDISRPISTVLTPEFRELLRPGKSPQETITFIGGPVWMEFDIDLGVTDIHVKGGVPTISFKGGGLKTDVGKNIPGNTRGLSVKPSRRKSRSNSNPGVIQVRR